LDEETKKILLNEGEYQVNLFGERVRIDERSKLYEKFIIPPFSVLDSRQGYWQNRKRSWIKGLSIKSELGRSKTKVQGSFSGAVPGYYAKKAAVEREIGEKLSNQDFEMNFLPILLENSVLAYTDKGGLLSIFDPVLCELAYRWFCPVGGQVIDCFAGGSVRGIVAHFLGYKYIGIDLNEEQIEENKKQGEIILGKENMPTWITGNSLNIDKICEGKKADFIFSCPPYFDLEQYTDNPEDLSNLEWDEFNKEYKKIIKKSCDLLKNNRFACFVVSEMRNRDTGEYRNFVGNTVKYFLDAGLVLWNELILLNVVGSVAMRVTNQFNNTRKIGRMHQNVLVFYKGRQENIKNIKFKNNNES